MGSQQHSFGGRALDRHLYDFETVETGDPLAAGAAAGDPANPAAADAGAAAGDGGQAGAEPGATDTAAPATPELPFDPRELQAELEYTRELNARLVEQLQTLTPAGQAGDRAAQTDPGLPELDPLDPDSVAAWQDAREQRLLDQIDQRLGQLAARFEQQDQAAVVEEGERRINDAIADDVARNGEFVQPVGSTAEERQPYEEADRQARQLVRTIAEQLFPSYAERYGAGPRAGEFAIEKASQQVRALLKAAGEAAVARQANRNATLAGQSGEPAAGAGAAATEQPVVKIGSRVIDRYAAAS